MLKVEILQDKNNSRLDNVEVESRELEDIVSLWYY